LQRPFCFSAQRGCDREAPRIFSGGKPKISEASSMGLSYEDVDLGIVFVKQIKNGMEIQLTPFIFPWMIRGLRV
jgi:hypothetical protein